MKGKQVSILVLLDVCKERFNTRSSADVYAEFQSLFYWMYVKNNSGGYTYTQ